MYAVNGDQRTLAGAMYIASPRPADDPTLTDWAGPLMTWHKHDNLCWAVGDDGKAKVVGVIDANGNCAKGVRSGGESPMVHVWIKPHPCGVFAALEGIGAGTAAVSEDQRVDMCGAGHDHGTARRPATAAAPKPYDPTHADRPQRHPRRDSPAAGSRREPDRGHPGPAPAVERLQGRRGVRLPQHRRRRHRPRALHPVGLDQRRRDPRPRPTREPGVRAATRRLEEARQRDVHAVRPTSPSRTCPTSVAP